MLLRQYVTGTRRRTYPAARVLASALAALLATGPWPGTAFGAEVVSGVALDDTGRPLSLAPVTVNTSDGNEVTTSRAGNNGAYCIGNEAIDGHHDYQACVTVRAGKAGCSSGNPHTIAGAMLDGSAYGLRKVDVSVRDEQGTEVARGRTDRDGNYCIVADGIQERTPYKVCITPAPMGSVPGGISGAMYGAENAPLRQARLSIRNGDGDVVLQARTSYEGTYCLTDDDLIPGMKQHLCAEVVAGAATCSRGVASTVSGAMTLGGGYPVARTPLTVETEDGTVVARGTTDDNGAYCVTAAELRPDETFQVCADLPAHCACCCSCCCAPPALILPPPIALLGLGVAAAGAGAGIGIGLGGFRIKGEQAVSPSQ